jgi:hypothetical protein
MSDEEEKISLETRLRAVTEQGICIIQTDASSNAMEPYGMGVIDQRYSITLDLRKLFAEALSHDQMSEILGPDLLRR